MIAEQEEVDFAIVFWEKLPLRLTERPEVYNASFGNIIEGFETHLELLKAIPEWMSLGVAVKTVKANPRINRAGAILAFTGIVRGDADALLFDIYEGEAQRRIEAIASDLRRMEGIVDVQIHHRSGRIGLGEDIVYIVVAASHRQEGFAALRGAIERIKSEVPIWKKELTETGGHWVGV
jgi:molybdopterin synthase catalytic subunit